MARFSFLALFLMIAGAQAFSVAPSTKLSTTPLTMSMSTEEEVEIAPPAPVKERGVSFDQDGKSNVWAIEPREEISSKSAEEKTSAALIAGGGIVAAAAFAAVVLTNLPDPNQF
uniref:Transmembrane protein n=1 Tax=Entomoneis paludosa TaxID=265537 RepID=A0A7S2YH25_9STRA|mmetsp:Transcript_32443/g.67664  ORF Transcript_32443/g.67664 Transcript_32443/m.67664 type:complete len:114 (+) Transcript_32443:153-494(+)|eukprot:CAMPEP_0172440394 /NCGR_PEP_ID=MMETSP1065-20121228/1017_1 /TAXON_ID=265537 /ORGANISM="Amphiprora paludosa, Strain CCMP125" /LENGTH=113 /DNA_ID=CAMNT_0013189187 /DNA_START=118 /DNA_END=459 /DNA_ORIENTATION=+